MFSYFTVFSALVCFAYGYTAVSEPSRWFNYNLNFYYVPTFTDNFYGAVEYCERNQMELLFIENKEELDAVTKFVKTLAGSAATAFWTSGSRLGNDKDYVWMSTGEKINVFDWGKGEPNNAGGNQKCLRIWVNYYKEGGNYDDIDCDSKYYAVCKSKPRIIHP